MTNPENDVVSRIDELVEESLAHGPTDNYDDPFKEHCHICGCEWHGLPSEIGCPGAHATEEQVAQYERLPQSVFNWPDFRIPYVMIGPPSSECEACGAWTTMLPTPYIRRRRHLRALPTRATCCVGAVPITVRCDQCGRYLSGFDNLRTEQGDVVSAMCGDCAHVDYNQVTITREGSPESTRWCETGWNLL